MNPRTKKIIANSMSAVMVIWMLAILVYLIVRYDGWLIFFMFLLTSPLFIPPMIGLLIILNYFHLPFDEKPAGTDETLSVFTTVTTTVFGVLTLNTFFLILYNSILFLDFSFVLSTFLIIFLVLAAQTLLCFGVGRYFQGKIRKCRTDDTASEKKRLRTTAITLVSVTSLCVLAFLLAEVLSL